MTIINVDQRTLAKLKYINTEGFIPGNYQFPDFLIIGPQRTGTTWLHRNLILHPNIYIPHTKELYFFNYLIIKNTEGSHYTSDRLEWYSKQFNISLKDYFQKNITILKSYRSLKYLDYKPFRFFKPDVRGEATASYAAMDDKLIDEIFALNPDIKIILMVRNPIERAWSHAKLQLSKKVKDFPRGMNFKRFKEFYSSDYMMRCGCYTDIIQRWKKFTGEENLFIGLFDEISVNPNNLLLRLLKFLGLRGNVWVNADEEIV